MVFAFSKKTLKINEKIIMGKCSAVEDEQVLIK
jgi:hypothetical protein